MNNDEIFMIVVTIEWVVAALFIYWMFRQSQKKLDE